MSATSAFPDEQVMPILINLLGPVMLCWCSLQSSAVASSVLETSAQSLVSEAVLPQLPDLLMPAEGDKYGLPCLAETHPNKKPHDVHGMLTMCFYLRGSARAGMLSIPNKWLLEESSRPIDRFPCPVCLTAVSKVSSAGS